MSPRFDIFAGPQTDPLWLESVGELNNAVARMEQRAQEEPGPYFVFDCRKKAVVASIDRGVTDSER